MTFGELGLSAPLLAAVRDAGYERPTPIQERAIPLVLKGRDLIGLAQTGTGKTAAFGLPLLQYVDPEMDEVQALVLTPTRELCIQVTQALRAYGARSPISSAIPPPIDVPTMTERARSSASIAASTWATIPSVV